MKHRIAFHLLALMLAARSAAAAEINVSAAISLSDALAEIAKAYAAAGGDTIRFNFGASSALALQIRQGAPADVFISADEAKMDALARAGLVVASTRRALLSNTLVIVVNAEGGAAISAPADLARPAAGRLALAETQTVPAGIYAKQYLEKLGLWKAVADRVIPTENVRACLAAVAAGNADAGIVYRTDALISKKVKIAYEVPVADGPRISYPVAVLTGARDAVAARRFADFLASPAARAIFVRFGFRPAD